MKALESSLEKELKTLDSLFDKTISIHALVDFVKTLDFVYIISYPDKIKWDMYMNYGFPLILFKAYQKLDLNIDSIPLKYVEQHQIDYCFNNLKYYGQYRCVERYLQMSYLNLVAISTIDPNNHFVEVDIKTGMADRYELLKIEQFFEMMKGVVKERQKHITQRTKRIQNQFRKKIYLTTHKLLGYDTNPEIDKFYSDKGFIRLVTSQIYDDFDENFEFGKIPYRQHLNIIEELMGVALKHIDACVYLSKKESLNPINLFSGCFSMEEMAISYSNYLDIPLKNVTEIFDLLTITKDNIDIYLKTDKAFSPPFIKIGNKYVMRSLKGILHHPVQFLHKSLQNKYPNEYQKGLLEREALFRDQLYSLFQDQRIIKIDRSVRIKLKAAGIETDIDAVLFDTKTQNLALIQLKWQDKYSTDLKERNSKANNFYNKANEWVEKMIRWQELTSQKQILNALGIIDYGSFNECYIFVIGRYNTHFPEKTPDKRATWGSWYHIFDLNWRFKTDFDDPIRELQFKLQFDSPLNKKSKIPDEEINLRTFNMKFKQKVVL